MGEVFGKFRATVSSIKDDKHMGRIKVKCPRIYGESESPMCIPCMPFTGDKWGSIMLPEVNDTVWIEFEEGDTEKPLYVGGWWLENKTPVQTDYDNTAKFKRVIKTKSGHMILFYEESGKEYVQIVEKHGNIVKLDDKGITLQDFSDNKIVTTDQGISIEDMNGNKVDMTSSGTVIESCSDMNLKANGDVTFNCQKVNFND